MNSVELLEDRKIELQEMAESKLGPLLCRGRGDNPNLARRNKLVNYMRSLKRSTKWLDQHVHVVETKGGLTPYKPYYQPFENLGSSQGVVYWAVRTPKPAMIEAAIKDLLAEIPKWSNYDGVESFPVSIKVIRSLAEALDNKELVYKLGEQYE